MNTTKTPPRWDIQSWNEKECEDALDVHRYTEDNDLRTLEGIGAVPVLLTDFERQLIWARLDGLEGNRENTEEWS